LEILYTAGVLGGGQSQRQVLVLPPFLNIFGTWNR
jgi:hypothetical protein